MSLDQTIISQEILQLDPTKYGHTDLLTLVAQTQEKSGLKTVDIFVDSSKNGKGLDFFKRVIYRSNSIVSVNCVAANRQVQKLLEKNPNYASESGAYRREERCPSIKVDADLFNDQKKRYSDYSNQFWLKQIESALNFFLEKNVDKNFTFLHGQIIRNQSYSQNTRYGKITFDFSNIPHSIEARNEIGQLYTFEIPPSYQYLTEGSIGMDNQFFSKKPPETQRVMRMSYQAEVLGTKSYLKRIEEDFISHPEQVEFKLGEEKDSYALRLISKKNRSHIIFFWKTPQDKHLRFTYLVGTSLPEFYGRPDWIKGVLPKESEEFYKKLNKLLASKNLRINI